MMRKKTYYLYSTSPQYTKTKKRLALWVSLFAIFCSVLFLTPHSSKAQNTQNQVAQNHTTQDKDISQSTKQNGKTSQQTMAEKAPSLIERFTQNEVVKMASNYLDMSAESMAEIIDVIFRKHGEPTAYIKGKEVAGALMLGLRYGQGEIVTKDGQRQNIFWSGPSIGLDTGAHGAKNFTLIYNLYDINDIFRRYAGIEGSAFYIAGVAVNYQRRGGIILAPMRVGLGARLGINAGYLKYTRKKRLLPF